MYSFVLYNPTMDKRCSLIMAKHNISSEYNSIKNFVLTFTISTHTIPTLYVYNPKTKVTLSTEVVHALFFKVSKNRKKNFR